MGVIEGEKTMKEIRIHARAGQGAITTAVILGQAYFFENKFVYAFPHFGAARMGAPMNAFVRVDDREVRLRSQIYEPDYLIIVDNSLLKGFNCFAGFRDKGFAVINKNKGEEVQTPKLKNGQKVYTVPANDIALETIGRPLGNTVLLGAYVAATEQIKLDSLVSAIEKRFAGKTAEGNVQAATQGFEYVKRKTG